MVSKSRFFNGSISFVLDSFSLSAFTLTNLCQTSYMPGLRQLHGIHVLNFTNVAGR